MTESSSELVARVDRGSAGSLDVVFARGQLYVGDQPIAPQTVSEWDREGHVQWVSDQARSALQTITPWSADSVAPGEVAGPSINLDGARPLHLTGAGIALVWTVTTLWVVAAALHHDALFGLWASLGLLFGLLPWLRPRWRRQLYGVAAWFWCALLGPVLGLAVPWVSGRYTYFHPHAAVSGAMAIGLPLAAGMALALAVGYSFKLIKSGL